MILTETSYYDSEEYGAPDRQYTVRSGDSLSRIASREYGDMQLWRQLYNYNRDLGLVGSNPNAIDIGDRLMLPDESVLRGTSNAVTLPAPVSVPSPPSTSNQTSMTEPDSEADAEDVIFGVPKKYAMIGGAVLVVGGIGTVYYMSTKKKKKR